MMAKYNDIENLSLEVLEAYIEKGVDAILPDEVALYLKVLEIIRGLHTRGKSKRFIISLLGKEPYNLSYFLSNRVYADSINFFYSDSGIRKEALANLYADKIENQATLLAAIAENSRDFDVLKNMFLAIFDLRTRHQKAEDLYPKELFEKPNKIYTQDITSLGFPKANRREIGKLIDAMPISELDKERLRGDANILEPKLFTYEHKEED